MFKVFKKKPKSNATPTFGSTGKSKSLFHLNKSGDKRKSGVALERDSPVKTLQYQQYDSSDQELNLQTSHSNQRHGFRSFLGDEAINNHYQDNWKKLSKDRSKSADALDTISDYDITPRANGHNPESPPAKSRNTWQGPDSQSVARRRSASLFLEQIATECSDEAPVTQFSTFKTSPQNETSTDSGYNSGARMNGGCIAGVTDISVPESFDVEDGVLCGLPPELDIVSVRSSQYDASVIMPPQGFNDTLTDSSHQHQVSPQSWTVYEDPDNISVISTSSSLSSHSAVTVQPQKPKITKSVSQEFSGGNQSEPAGKLRSHSSYPALPPKPSVKINQDKYKPGNKTYGVTAQTSLVNGHGEVSRSGKLEPSMRVDSVDSGLVVSSKDSSDVPSTDEEVSLKPKPTPPPRSKRLGSAKKSPLAESLSATSESESNSVEHGDDIKTAAVMSDENLGEQKFRAPDSENNSCIESDSSTRSFSDKENVEHGLTVLPGPMIMSLREQMKRSPPKINLIPSTPRAVEVPIIGGQILDHADAQSMDTISAKPPLGKPNPRKSLVSTFQEPKNLTHNKEDLLMESGVEAQVKKESWERDKTNMDESTDGVVVGQGSVIKTHSAHRNKVETSSRLSNVPDIDICSLSSINESAQIMISDSFLDDAALSSYEPSEADSDDSEVSFKVTMVMNSDRTDSDSDAERMAALNMLANYGRSQGMLSRDSDRVGHRGYEQVRRDISRLGRLDLTVSGLDATMDESSAILLSDSFLNDTVTPLINTSIQPLGDTTIIVEEDYDAIMGVEGSESQPNQPWEVSMAMSWGATSQQAAKRANTPVQELDADSVGSTDSDVTVAEDDHDAQLVPPGVYRWQLKPVSLWDTEDVCQWLGSKNMNCFIAAFRENVISGSDLLQISLTDLGELARNHGNERLRQKLQQDVQSLQDPQDDSHLSTIKKISMKRRDLEDSNEALSERLDSLAWQNRQLETAIGTDLKRLEQERTEATVLLKHEDSDPSHAYTKLPIMKWSNFDVISWLESVGMERFSPSFKAHGITGQDLVSIDMELLDSLGMSSVQDRELILSRLYELQHPESNVGHVARLKEIFQQPPSLDSDKNSQRSSNSNKSTSRKLFGEDEKSDKENISGRSMKIWHDVTGEPTGTTVLVTSDMTSHDVIQMVLQEHHLVEDPGHFIITRITMDTNSGKVSTSDLADKDYPTIVHKNITNSEIKARLELRSKNTRKVEVIFYKDEEISISKQLDVSSMCTCGELLGLAMAAFSLHDTETYDVQAVGDDDIPQVVGATKLLLMYDCEAFLLVEKQEAVDIITRTSHDQLEGASNSRQKSQQWQKMDIPDPIPEPVHRVSVAGHDWTSVTGTESQLDPDLTTICDDQDLEKLSTLSDDLECLSRVTHSFSDLDLGRQYSQEQPNVFTFHTDGENLRKYQEEVSEMREGLHEKDKIIHRLQVENEQAKADHRQAEELRSLFASIELDMKQRQTDLQTKYHQIESDMRTAKDTTSVPSQEEFVESLQQALMVLGQLILLVEQRETLLQAQMGTARANLRSDPGIMEQLKHQLSETDDCLMSLKQQQADKYRQLKMARKHLLKMQKSSIDADRFSIYKLLRELGHNPSMLQQVLAIDLGRSANRCDYILGRDHQDRAVVKHAEESSKLQKGDRVLEVSGSPATHLSDTDLSKMMMHGMSGAPANVVVLRKTTNYELKVQEKVEEAESIREDLSLTMMELEAAQEENTRLQQHIHSLSSDESRLRAESVELESRVEESEAQLQQHKAEVHAQINQFRLQLEEKENEITDLRAKMERSSKHALQALSRSPSILSRRSDSGLRTNTEEESVPHINGHAGWSPEGEAGTADLVLPYEDYGSSPIWESLHQAPKCEVLQALKDVALENYQQKEYLDHLLTAVIDHAPNLIQLVDQCMGVQDQSCLQLKIRSEEFC